MSPSRAAPRRRLRRVLSVVALSGWLWSPVQANGQWTGVVGLDGVLSNRAENAFGAGLTLAYGHSALSWKVLGVNASLKFMGLTDAEFVTGARTDPDIDLPGDRYYYRRSNDMAVPPEIAEAPSPIRAYYGLYGLLDICRLRLGLGRSGHLGATDGGWAVMGGLAASTTSWIMIEAPRLSGFSSDGWRLRIEVTLAGPEYLWK